MSLSKGRKTHAHLLRRTCFSNHPGDGVHTAKSPAANGLMLGGTAIWEGDNTEQRALGGMHPIMDTSKDITKLSGRQ